MVIQVFICNRSHGKIGANAGVKLASKTDFAPIAFPACRHGAPVLLPAEGCGLTLPCSSGVILPSPVLFFPFLFLKFKPALLFFFPLPVAFLFAAYLIFFLLKL